jgi:hypothetical protein
VEVSSSAPDKQRSLHVFGSYSVQSICVGRTGSIKHVRALFASMYGLATVLHPSRRRS